jgi:hypothetical protein
VSGASNIRILEKIFIIAAILLITTVNIIWWFG